MQTRGDHLKEDFKKGEKPSASWINSVAKILNKATMSPGEIIRNHNFAWIWSIATGDPDSENPSGWWAATVNTPGSGTIDIAAGLVDWKGVGLSLTDAKTALSIGTTTATYAWVDFDLTVDAWTAAPGTNWDWDSGTTLPTPVAGHKFVPICVSVASGGVIQTLIPLHSEIIDLSWRA